MRYYVLLMALLFWGTSSAYNCIQGADFDTVTRDYVNSINNYFVNGEAQAKANLAAAKKNAQQLEEVSIKINHLKKALGYD
jgi:hypothetical protein